MIQASELRIGSLILYKGEVIEVGSIRKDTDYDNKYFIEEFNDEGVKTFGVNLDLCEPILLTEEWHNKFGVNINGFHSFEYAYDIGKSIVFVSDYVYLINTDRIDGERSLNDSICTLWNKDVTKRDMYVHEWQNLYFALTGEELNY